MTSGGSGIGGDGTDRLTGNGLLYSLYGGAGNDTFNLNTAGDAYGGEGGDIYNVNSSGTVYIQDIGAAGVNDYVYLNNIATKGDVYSERIGDNLYVTSINDINDNGLGDSGVLLLGWYTGWNSIEFFATADNAVFQLV